MSVNSADRVLPASANFEKLKVKLRELFELDKADLDFGIYRILRVRHKEIAEFLDKHLEKTVREALQSHSTVHQAQVEEDLRKAEQAAKEAGITPEQSPRVMEIRERLHDENSIDALADEVYSQLYTFFSRYYQEGDFLGLQRSTVHGREKYMIPYNGEEVKLIWANMDQYYIKSSELLRDYSFHITPGEGTLLKTATNERITIHFKLVEGDTEKDNRKPGGKTTRAFALDADSPFIESSSLAPKGGEGQGEGMNTLSIRFRYRELAAERNLQDKLNADTIKTLADNLPPKWKEALFAADTGYQSKDKKDTRTILQKHLRAYTAKHQFDYFIHKDLGGFLRRELDFYIKNEVMYLDDVENLGAPKAEEYLSKIRALRRCALPVIDMLEQLENFQKKLWLKKKFVVETRYCITLDRVPEELYSEIAGNAAQCEEWVKLYAINEIEPNLTLPGYTEPVTVEFLKANPYLMIDTRHFDREFTLKLLASIDNLDESLDGVCFHSENFQALQLMQERYKEEVQCTYIDPPYNTGGDGFAYKDRYQHSSYASMMQDRVRLAKHVMNDSSGLFVSINEIELSTLRLLFANEMDSVNIITVKTKVAGVSGSHHGKSLRNATEYLLIYAKSGDHFAFTDKVYDTQELIEYVQEMESSGKSWKYTSALMSVDEGNYVKSINDGSGNEIKIYEHNAVSIQSVASLSAQSYAGNLRKTYYENIDRIFRTTNAQSSIRMRVCEETTDIVADIISIVYTPKTGRNAGKSIRLYYKDTARNLITFLRDTVVTIDDTIQKKISSGTLWADIQYNNLALEGGVAFPNGKKPLLLVRKVIDLSLDHEGLVLDYFAGSATTGHAVINLNREDGGTRKYLLVEMGEYFDTVLVPRIKKVVYSTDWKDGKPQNRNTGISHAFKIVRLESYEDALNNLRLKRTPEQEAALDAAPERVRDQYMLSYFLDVESAGSASLLDLDQFRDPFTYKLKIATSSAGETNDTNIDLVETFNWLLGLKVMQMKAQQGFLTVIGEKRAGGRTLVIWRSLTEDLLADNAALEKFLSELKVKPADTEFDYIYVNGSHTLTDPHNKVHLIEEAFQRLMFDGGSFESLE